MDPVNTNSDSTPSDSASYQEVICLPPHNWQPVSTQAATEALDSACWDYRGWPFVFYLPNGRSHPRYGDEVIYAFNNKPFFRVPRHSFWMFNYKTGVFFARNLRIEYQLQKAEDFDPRLQVKLVSEAVIAMGRIYSTLNLDLDTNLLLGIRYTKMYGVRIASLDDNFMLYPGDAYAGNELKTDFMGTIADFLTSPETVAGSMTEQFVDQMGHNDGLRAQTLSQIAREYLAKGHKVNP